MTIGDDKFMFYWQTYYGTENKVYLILIKSITESVFIIDKKKISFAFANHHLFQPGKKMLDR